jgi:hypothetical protein
MLNLNDKWTVRTSKYNEPVCIRRKAFVMYYSACNHEYILDSITSPMEIGLGRPFKHNRQIGYNILRQAYAGLKRWDQPLDERNVEKIVDRLSIRLEQWCQHHMPMSANPPHHIFQILQGVDGGQYTSKTLADMLGGWDKMNDGNRYILNHKIDKLIQQHNDPVDPLHLQNAIEDMEQINTHESTRRRSSVAVIQPAINPHYNRERFPNSRFLSTEPPNQQRV